jgi:hypothetical protein
MYNELNIPKAIRANGEVLSVTELRKLVTEVKEYSECIAWHPQGNDGDDGVQAAIGGLQALMESLGKKPTRVDSPLSE